MVIPPLQCPFLKGASPNFAHPQIHQGDTDRRTNRQTDEQTGRQGTGRMDGQTEILTFLAQLPKKIRSEHAKWICSFI